MRIKEYLNKVVLVRVEGRFLPTEYYPAPRWVKLLGYILSIVIAIIIINFAF
jgi:hypothetical protein